MLATFLGCLPLEVAWCGTLSVFDVAFQFQHPSPRGGVGVVALMYTRILERIQDSEEDSGVNILSDPSKNFKIKLFAFFC